MPAVVRLVVCCLKECFSAASLPFVLAEGKIRLSSVKESVLCEGNDQCSRTAAPMGEVMMGNAFRFGWQWLLCLAVRKKPSRLVDQTLFILSRSK